MVFPVVTYGCESWTVKKAKCQRVDAFKLWCWRRLLQVPWTARRSKQSILREIKPWLFTRRTEAEAPALWSPAANRRLIGKAPDAGKDWEQEKRASEDETDGWTASPLQWTWTWANFGRWRGTRRSGVLPWDFIVFIAELFAIAGTWKQSRSPSTAEWIKMWYKYTMEYYSAKKIKFSHW